MESREPPNLILDKDKTINGINNCCMELVTLLIMFKRENTSEKAFTLTHLIKQMYHNLKQLGDPFIDQQLTLDQS